MNLPEGRYLITIMEYKEWIDMMTGWWYTYPLEKYGSQWEGLSYIIWKIKHV